MAVNPRPRIETELTSGSREQSDVEAGLGLKNSVTALARSRLGSSFFLRVKVARALGHCPGASSPTFWGT